MSSGYGGILEHLDVEGASLDDLRARIERAGADSYRASVISLAAERAAVGGWTHRAADGRRAVLVEGAALFHCTPRVICDDGEEVSVAVAVSDSSEWHRWPEKGSDWLPAGATFGGAGNARASARVFESALRELADLASQLACAEEFAIDAAETFRGAPTKANRAKCARLNQRVIELDASIAAIPVSA